MSKIIRWSVLKNTQLKLERNISFETILSLLDTDNVLADVEHPNLVKYPNQRIFVLLIVDYVYMVPYIENDEEIFLKTIIPSRKLTKQYLGVQNG
jgi:hypothetical protein